MVKRHLPARSLSLFALGSVLGACGATEERTSTDRPTKSPTEPREEQRVDAAALYGAWRYDYVTAGAVANHMVFRFAPDGTLELESSSMDSFTEPPTMANDKGTFEVTDAGTVRFSWAQDTGWVWEHTLAIVENAENLAMHGCCDVESTSRYWTFMGYLALDEAGTRFEKVFGRPASDGVDAPTRTTTRLTFPAPPGTLAAEGACRVDLTVEVEVELTEGSEVRALEDEFPCRVQRDGALRVITIPGLDTVEGAPLLEQPHRASTVWRQYLDDNEDVVSWSEPARLALERAFEPYLAQDPERPAMLLHPITANSFEIDGLAWVEPSE